MAMTQNTDGYSSMNPGLIRLVAVALLVLTWLASSSQELQATSLEAKIGPRRRPVAIELSPSERELWVANESGSVMRLSTDTGEIQGEWRVGGKLSDLCVLDEYHVAVTVFEPPEVVLMRSVRRGLQIVDRLETPKGPIRIRHQATDGEKIQSLYVACQWGRALLKINIDSPPNESTATPIALEFGEVRQTRLSFAPREILVSTRPPLLLVTDALSGAASVLDPDCLDPINEFSVLGHNIRGLAFSPDKESVFLTQQILNPLAHSSYDDLHWGLLLTNVVREISVDEITAATPSAMPRSRKTQLGTVGLGAGDPGRLAVRSDGSRVVVLQGVGAVAVLSADGTEKTRLRVGPGPSDLCLDAKGKTAYLPLRFADRVAAVSLDDPDGSAPRVRLFSLGGSREESLVDRGARLFRDATLSHDGWMSCQSCHSEGHTNHGLSDTLGDGSHGTPKRVLSLLGTGETAPYAWNGSLPSLEAQITKTLRTTMHATSVDPKTVKALAAFVRSLPPPPPLLDNRNTASVRRGRQVFDQAGCSRCHEEPQFTTASTHDVGLTDERGASAFNPPSLRGVARQRRLFHDGRARSLTTALRDFSHPGTDLLNADEIADLVEFLKRI